MRVLLLEIFRVKDRMDWLEDAMGKLPEPNLPRFYPDS
jgi:hypothetical protein